MLQVSPAPAGPRAKSQEKRSKCNDAGAAAARAFRHASRGGGGRRAAILSAHARREVFTHPQCWEFEQGDLDSVIPRKACQEVLIDMVLVSESQRMAILAHTLPRRTQLPNRLDPFDCTICAAHLKAIVAGCVCRCAAGTGTPQARRVRIGKHNITILEEDGTYSTRLWHSSTVLAPLLASHSEVFDGKVFLEVGAGTGLCSLAVAATASSAQVIASDYDEAGLALLRRSADEHEPRLQICRIDICSTLPLPHTDWLVASDVLYTPQLAESMALRCLEVLAQGGRCIVADPGRPARRQFQALLELHGMAASFRQPGHISFAPDGPRLLLLHVPGEHSVSSFGARAELEG